MTNAHRSALAVGFAVNFVAASAMATTITLDFETDDGGVALVNGQSIDSFVRADRQGVPFSLDSVQEFGNVVNIYSVVDGAGDGHVDATIFDSDPFGPNMNSEDTDMLVNSGNVLILQEDRRDANNGGIGPNGLVYNTPNDEGEWEDRGTIVFDFINPGGLTTSPQSIDLIDINGGNLVFVSLIDSSGLNRQWTITSDFTGPGTLDTLDLTDVGLQIGVGGGTATAVTQVGFDPDDVVSLSVTFSAEAVFGAVSGGLDNLVFAQIPVPPALLLFGSALAWLIGWRRTQAH